MERREKYDVAIIGGGPCGSAAAIKLARSGASVVLFEKSHPDVARAGECLTPLIREPLHDLGLWTVFENDGHIPLTGITSYWGSSDRSDTDFVSSAYGQGWALDRLRFDRMLSTTAEAEGTDVRQGRWIVNCRKDAHGWWELTSKESSQPVNLRASFILNASGRNGNPSGLIIHRLAYDRLVAVVRHGDILTAQAPTSGRLTVETCEYGWWYSVILPKGRLVSAFFTDADFLAGPLAHREHCWNTSLASAPQTKKLLAIVDRFGPLRVIPAWSSCGQPVAGADWLSAGDAALSHDPLSGQGIYRGLRGGIAAAEIIHNNSPTQLQQYASDIERLFWESKRMACNLYQLERRWPYALFWRRRLSASNRTLVDPVSPN